MADQRPTPLPRVGQDVEYVLREGPSAGQSRPAVIVRVWNDVNVNLVVFTDGNNDRIGPDGSQPGYVGNNNCVAWVTSVLHDEDPKKGGTWHYPAPDPAASPAPAPAPSGATATTATTGGAAKRGGAKQTPATPDAGTAPEGEGTPPEGTTPQG